MKIFIDFDNTIVDTTYAFINWYNLTHYEDVKCEDICEYDFNPQVSLSKDEVSKAFSLPLLYQCMMLYEDVSDSLFKLRYELGCELILVTNCCDNSVIRKLEWLEQHKPLSDMFNSKIFISSNKSYGKSSIDMSSGILIDDHKENHRLSNAKYKFAYKKYPNCNWYPTEDDGVLVTNSWKTIVDEIELICQKKIK